MDKPMTAGLCIMETTWQLDSKESQQGQLMSVRLLSTRAWWAQSTSPLKGRPTTIFLSKTTNSTKWVIRFKPTQLNWGAQSQWCVGRTTIWITAGMSHSQKAAMASTSILATKAQKQWVKSIRVQEKAPEKSRPLTMSRPWMKVRRMLKNLRWRKARRMTSSTIMDRT